MDMSRSGALGIPMECLWKHQPAFYLQPLRRVCPPLWEVNMLSRICYDSCVSPHRFQGKGVNMVFSAAFSLSQLVKYFFFFNVNLMGHLFIDLYVCMLKESKRDRYHCKIPCSCFCKKATTNIQINHQTTKITHMQIFVVQVVTPTLTKVRWGTFPRSSGQTVVETMTESSTSIWKASKWLLIVLLTSQLQPSQPEVRPFVTLSVFKAAWHVAGPYIHACKPLLLPSPIFFLCIVPTISSDINVRDSNDIPHHQLHGCQ